ncbi:hypothetical protein ACFQJD_13680 [Haloplanus sp. GCM10025708]|uniref:hypothetical protein n=1 Tax=Haloferacaceae TaxID=1644056 RepID=UPI0036204229
MSLKTALRQSRVVTFALLAASVWTILTMIQVYRSLGPLSETVPGQTWASGVVGLLVLAALLGLFVYAFAEAGDAQPQPTPFSPDE